KKELFASRSSGTDARSRGELRRSAIAGAAKAATVSAIASARKVLMFPPLVRFVLRRYGTARVAPQAQRVCAGHNTGAAVGGSGRDGFLAAPAGSADNGQVSVNGPGDPPNPGGSAKKTGIALQLKLPCATLDDVRSRHPEL